MITRKVVLPQAYLLAFASCLAAIPITRALDAPASGFILIVMGCTLYGGRGPGIFSALLSGIAFTVLFTPPSLLAGSPEALLRVSLFAGAMLVTIILIEARRRSEYARQQLDEDFRSIAITSPDCILSVASDGHILFANTAFTLLFGFTREETQGCPLSMVLPSIGLGQRSQGEALAVRKDGTIFIVEATCGGFGDKTTVFLRDISQRIRDRKRLEQSEESLRLTLETMPGLVFARTSAGNLEYANKQLYDYVGSEIEWLSSKTLGATMHVDDREANVARILDATARGDPYSLEYRTRRYDGAYRWIHQRVHPLKDQDGQVIRWYGLLTDIDDFRTAQESVRQMQVKLSKAAQVAAVSELSASIAHEISQPLSAIVANGQAAVRWLDNAPSHLEEARAAIERIVRDGKDVKKIIEGLRSLFNQSSARKEPLDVAELCTQIMSLIRDKAEQKDCAVHLSVATDLPSVLGDRIQLQQVLINLASNGVDAMETVEDRRKSIQIRASKADPFVLFEIEDSGVGIADYNAIFDSFFTTKTEGLGMGLAICRNIVTAHEGTLWGRESASGGAIFAFTVPAAEGSARV